MKVTTESNVSPAVRKTRRSQVTQQVLLYIALDTGMYMMMLSGGYNGRGKEEKETTECYSRE